MMILVYFVKTFKIYVAFLLNQALIFKYIWYFLNFRKDTRMTTCYNEIALCPQDINNFEKLTKYGTDYSCDSQ